MNDISENVIYLCYYKTKSLRSNHVTCVSPTTPNMYILKWFRFIIAKIYNILRYVIDHKQRHMYNLHIKETKISQKQSKGIKNWKITYSVILSVLSNKTNLILGFSSPLIGNTELYNKNSTTIKKQYKLTSPGLVIRHDEGLALAVFVATLLCFSFVER